jgi:hypothetical protein
MPQQPYGIDSAIKDVGDNIAQNASRYHALPPLKKNRFRAGAGAGLIALGLYTVIGRYGIVFADWLSFVIWAAVVGFGVLWFSVGISGARSPREVMSAFWSIIAVVIFGFLAFVAVHLLDGSDFNFFMEGFFVAGLVGSIVRLWLALRGMPSTSLDAVKAQQAHGRARDASQAEAAAKLNENAAPRPQREFHS